MCQTAFSSSCRVIEESGWSLSGLGETYTNSYWIICLWFHSQYAGATLGVGNGQNAKISFLMHDRQVKHFFFLLLSIQQPKWRRNSTFIQMLRRMSQCKQCKFPRPPKRMSNNEVVECCQSLEWINQSVVKIKVQNFNSKSKQYAFDHYLTFFCVKLYPILYYCQSNITHKTTFYWKKYLF